MKYGFRSDVPYKNFASELLSSRNLNVLRLAARSAGLIYAPWSIDDVPPLLIHSNVAPIAGPFLSSLRSSRKQAMVGTECSHNLPSWVICWTCKPAPTAQLLGTYNAGGPSPSPVNFSPSSSSITAWGHVFDTMDSLSSFFWNEVDTGYPVDSAEATQSIYGDMKATKTALWKTLVADTTAEGGIRAPASYSCLLDQRMWSDGRVPGVYGNGFSLNGIMTRNKDLNVCGYTLQELILGSKRLSWQDKMTQQQMTYNLTEDERQALSWAMNTTAWRRIAGTKTGRMGLVPAATRVKDAIAVVLGCITPLVLRKSTDGWTIVGESYIHGVMDEEMVAKGCELSEIKIY